MFGNFLKIMWSPVVRPMSAMGQKQTLGGFINLSNLKDQIAEKFTKLSVISPIEVF